ncbi:hypothetical protein EVAR_8580_1 [Eumeta japonica]|uniref:Uncharacterized protein n=1 Tax=Eumeta variegata TaxID=151549 RepID=A0A4C1TXI0_EUMVA|nr:hypothetical protein EVAR_8580_1 [Eumeta japonica]
MRRRCAECAAIDAVGLVGFCTARDEVGPHPQAAIDADLGATAGESRRASCSVKEHSAVQPRDFQINSYLSGWQFMRLNERWLPAAVPKF